MNTTYHVARANALGLLLSLGLLAGCGGAAIAQTMTLDVCPTDYGSFPENAPPLSCGCSAEAAKDGSVRGANPYYYQSSICRAAVHAGAISATGGQILVEPAPAPFFPAVTRNGVAADSWGEGMGFRVVVSAAPAAAPPAAEAPAATTPAPTTPPAAAAAPATSSPTTPSPTAPAPSAGMTLDICPTDYDGFPEDAPALTCGCSADAVKTGDIRGANPYYYQSSVCRAALHAGAVGAEGGQIVVEPASQPFFPGVKRNDIESDSWGQGMGFKVAAAPGGATTAVPAIDANGASELTLDICPVDYDGFPEDAPPVTCACSADAVKEGSVRGTNPYYYQSAICRAALHAGVTGAEGGMIVIGPEKAVVFPAVNKNGVESDSWGEGMGFKVSAVPGAAPVVAAAPPPAEPAVDSSGQPVQAPIAETLKATGRVQLYINFATDKAEPLPTSEPVLQELLATLQGDAALKVELIGHTDSQGSAPYNLDLSQRRAAAVYLWLVQHGIESARLRSDGRGLLEPIADNATDQGRALNRRVEVKAVN